MFNEEYMKDVFKKLGVKTEELWKKLFSTIDGTVGTEQLTQATGFEDLLSNEIKFDTLQEILYNESDIIYTITNSNSDLHKVLQALSITLEELSDQNKHFFVLLEDAIALTEGGKLFLNWLEMEKFSASDDMQIEKEIWQKYQNYMHPNIRNAMITYDIINTYLCRYAFSMLLLKILCPKLSFDWISKIDALENLNLIEPNIPIELQCLLEDLLKQKDISMTCPEILEKVVSTIQNSFIIKQVNQNIKVEISYNTQHGRNKKIDYNEDTYYYFKQDESKLFLMVADGVSTADIGSGESISYLIRETLKDSENKIKDFLANPKKDQIYSFMNELLLEVNQKAIQKINSYNKKIEEDTHVMSSTIIMSIAIGNVVYSVYIGDSEIIGYREKRAYVLNEAHTVKNAKILHNLAKIKSGEKPSFFKTENNDEHLIKTIPTYILKETKLVEDNLEPGTKTLYTKKGDILIFASDGLLTCFGDNKRMALKELEDYLTNHPIDKKNIKDYARKLVNTANEKSGSDDITVVMLSFIEEENENKQKVTSEKSKGVRI